jgi:hypothetical protein
MVGPVIVVEAGRVAVAETLAADRFRAVLVGVHPKMQVPAVAGSGSVVKAILIRVRGVMMIVGRAGMMTLVHVVRIFAGTAGSVARVVMMIAARVVMMIAARVVTMTAAHVVRIFAGTAGSVARVVMMIAAHAGTMIAAHAGTMIAARVVTTTAARDVFATKMRHRRMPLSNVGRKCLPVKGHGNMA